MSLKTRTQSPPTYSNYRSYKPFLRMEFQHRCVYCGVREAEDGGSKKFHIDHYMPKKQFPEKICEYSNLYYSCNECNIFKSNFWPNLFQRFMKLFILNPCDHDLDKHYDCNSPEWIAKTNTAIWNIDRLRLNSPARLQQRKDRIFFYHKVEDMKDRVENLEDIKSKQKLDQKIAEIQKEIEIYKRKIETPTD